MKKALVKVTTHPDKVTLQTIKGKEMFSPVQIIRLEAQSNYTRIYFIDHFAVTTAKVLKQFEDLLMPAGFIRTHRRHLINKEHICKVRSNSCILMTDSSIAEISRRRKSEVLKALNGFG